MADAKPNTSTGKPAEKPTSVEGYLESLPLDRRGAMEAVREAIRSNLPEGYEEGIQYGMIAYYVPHSLYPTGYHCNPKEPLPFASIASQKNHMAIYLFCVYGKEGEAERFAEAWEATGKKLDMGKSCVRFKRAEDVPLDLVGETVARFPVEEYIASYEAGLPEGILKKVMKRKAELAEGGGAASKKTKKKAVKKKAESGGIGLSELAGDDGVG